jgi:hypothetical protein
MRFVLLLLVLYAPAARAEEIYHAIVDGNTAGTNSLCLGLGTFTLSQDETQLHYEIHFTNWVDDEFAAHIHELNFPPSPGEHIVEDIAEGPDKIGAISVTEGDVVALRAQMMFVVVHTLRNQAGEVKGWIVPGVAAKPTTWGAVRVSYR